MVLISERTREALKKLGLTKYEIRAYITLLEQEVRTASQISKNSGVPFSKIYGVLSNLKDKGWVEVEHSRPNKYYPKSPSFALGATRLRIESTLRSNEQQILDELQPLYERKGAHEKPEIWIVRGELNILSKIYEMLERSKEELLAVIPIIDNTIVDLFSNSLMELYRKGVNVMIMSTKTLEDKALKKLSFTEIRVRDQMFGGGVISDGREVILLLGEKRDDKLDLAIWSDHIELAKFAKNYFEYLWNSSENVKNQF